VGLVGSSLAAGAVQVVANLWLVPDIAAAELMVSFHEERGRGLAAFRALALAQRRANAAGKPARVWGGFSITGACV
jgi:CHAT domain-containing protein